MLWGDDYPCRTAFPAHTSHGQTAPQMAALGLEDGRIAVVDPLVATAPPFTVLFAAVLLRDLERATRGIVAGAGLIVVGAAMITM